MPTRSSLSSLLTLALLTVSGASLPALAASSTVQPKAEQVLVLRVGALAHATLSDAALASAQAAPETVTISADYLYKRDLKVSAYDLDTFLKARIPGVEALAAEGAQIMFWCRDGYAPVARLSDVLGQGGLIAVADAEAPAGVRWPDAPYKNEVLRADDIGRYVEWRSTQFPAKPQPWGLETLYILPASAAIRK